MKRAVIIGTGSYLPEKRISNKDLEAIVETNDEWIRTRTGITQRYVAAPGELTSDMAAAAIRNALAGAKVEAMEVDAIILATTTPDRTFPSTAAIAQAKLGIGGCAAFDVQAVCAGFIYALSVADNFIRSGQYKTVVVAGAEKMTSILDWQDRATCVLFGDGAGAVVVRGMEEKEANGRGILSSHLHADGSYEALLYADGGVGLDGGAGKLRMQGQEVFKHAVEKMSASVKEALAFNHLEVSDINWMVPHQANSRILQSVGKRLSLPEEKVISTVGVHANTSAASIPLALQQASSSNLLKRNDLVVLSAIGGGFAWGATVLRW